MSRIGFGYGSEWHLTHHLGRHRNALGREVLAATGAAGVDWLDFRRSGADGRTDAEWQGLDFLFQEDGSGLLDHAHLKDEWAAFWPQTGTPPCWDAVAMLRYESRTEWLLLEAKAHVGEMRTDRGCGAKGAGREQIVRALAGVGAALGVPDTTAWTGEYYQYANRLATLWFLITHGVPARLLYVYFTGECHGNWICPAAADDWKPHLDVQDRALGLDRATNPAMLNERVHKIHLKAQRAI